MTVTTLVPEFSLKRARRRTIALHVARDGSLEVRAPQWVPRRDILAFVTEKADWIARQRERLSSLPPFEHPVFADGGSFRLFGDRYSVSVDHTRCAIVCAPSDLNAGVHGQAAGPEARDRFEIRVRQSAGPTSCASAIRKVIRARLLDFIHARILYWRGQEVFRQLPALQVTLRLMKRRWGSCRRNGSLTFSETLARYPAQCIDAVIVHELCHLQHFNHGPAFYALMTRALPDWRSADRLLDAESKRY